MTWLYEIGADGDKLMVYDHNGNLIKTVSNDGDGFRFVEVVSDVMKSEAQKARNNDNMSRWRDIHIRLAAKDIAAKE